MAAAAAAAALNDSWNLDQVASQRSSAKLHAQPQQSRYPCCCSSQLPWENCDQAMVATDGNWWHLHGGAIGVADTTWALGEPRDLEGGRDLKYPIVILCWIKHSKFNSHKSTSNLRFRWFRYLISEHIWALNVLNVLNVLNEIPESFQNQHVGLFGPAVRIPHQTANGVDEQRPILLKHSQNWAASWTSVPRIPSGCVGHVKMTWRKLEKPLVCSFCVLKKLQKTFSKSFLNGPSCPRLSHRTTGKSLLAVSESAMANQ